MGAPPDGAARLAFTVGDGTLAAGAADTRVTGAAGVPAFDEWSNIDVHRKLTVPVWPEKLSTETQNVDPPRKEVTVTRLLTSYFGPFHPMSSWEPTGRSVSGSDPSKTDIVVSKFEPVVENSIVLASAAANLNQTDFVAGTPSAAAGSPACELENVFVPTIEPAGPAIIVARV